MTSKLEHALTVMTAAFFNLMGRVPRKGGIFLGNLLGRLIFALDARHRRITLENLTHALGPELTPGAIRKLARAIFQNLGQLLFEIGWSLRLPPRDFPKYVRIQGADFLRAAMARQKGVFLLTAHIGNWELTPLVQHMLSLPISVPYRPLDFTPLDSFFVNLRARFGARQIPLAEAREKIVENVGQGDAIFMLMDQNVDPRQGVFVDFFGRPACANKGLARLALFTDVPVVPAFLVREGAGFLMIFQPEVPFVRSGDVRKDVEENTQTYNRIIEKMVRRYPAQWFWVHQRWKARPYSPWPREPK